MRFDYFHLLMFIRKVETGKSDKLMDMLDEEVQGTELTE